MALKAADQQDLSDLLSICNTLAAGKQPFSEHCLYKLLGINIWFLEHFSPHWSELFHLETALWLILCGLNEL